MGRLVFTLLLAGASSAALAQAQKPDEVPTSTPSPTVNATPRPVFDADTVPPSPQNNETAAGDTREIIVTGTAIRGVAPVGSATVNISRSTLLETGARDAAAAISQLPQGSGLGTTLTSTGGRAAGVNLRGLGNNATLVLFDGHRWVPQGVTNQISDPNVIPFAAIERVEVVTDGASAIYGSDAVAGVVNYIFRKDYEGAEITGRYTDFVYHQKQAEGVVGHRWSTGNLMATFSFSTQGRVPSRFSPYLRQDLRPFGGNDARFNGTSVFPGTTPDLLVGTTVYGLPQTNGAVPTAAQVLPLLNQPNLYDQADYSDYFAARTTFSGLFRARQEFGDHVEVAYTALYAIRDNRSIVTEAFNNLSLALPPSSPYYIRGLGTALNPTPTETLIYNVALNNPGRQLLQNSHEDNFNNTLDLRVDLPGDFQLKSYVTYGESTGCAACNDLTNSVISTIITTQYASSFNPYLAGPQEASGLLIGGFLQEGSIRMVDTVHKIDGSLFHLPGGAVRVAVGGEYTRFRYHLTAQNKLNLTNTFQISRLADSRRSVYSAFGEMFIPVFGADNARPFFQRFDISAAIRYDRYSDDGNTTNPKVGITWKPFGDLTLRGSYGTSFRAPTLIESNPATVGQTNRVYVANGAGDPAIPVTLLATGQSAILNRTGNTAGLRPESARVWSLGADVAPSFVRGLRLGITYYDVSYRDRIDNLPNQTLAISSAVNRQLYKDYLIVAPQPSTCVNGNYATYNPAYLPFLTDPNAVFSPSTINDCTLTGIINGGRQNLGRVIQKGLDLTANYQLQTQVGRFSLGGSFTKILDLKRSLTRSAPLSDALDTIGNQISARGRFNAGWSLGGLTINGYLNYTGSYLNNATITVNSVRLPDTRIPAWKTFDASLSYTVPENRAGMLHGIRMSVNLQNLTDKDPPVVLSGTSAYDAANANLFGRIWSVELTKKF